MKNARFHMLLALAALLAPRVQASRTSVWESNPPAADVLTATSSAGLLASLAPAVQLDASAPADVYAAERPRFDLGDVVLVESELEHEERFGLAPLDLLGPTPLRGPPPSYPETRVRGFDLLPPFRVGASPTLSLWSRQVCGFACLGLASDGPQDPWGLQSADTEMSRLLGLAQSAANEATDEIARRHGISPREAAGSGRYGTEIHAAMERLLSPGGKYHDERFISEAEVDPLGLFRRGGRRGFAAKESMVKDLVILNPGESIRTVRRGTPAKDVTFAVLDLKTGLLGARQRQTDTLARFGTNSAVLKPFGDMVSSFERSRVLLARQRARIERVKALASKLPDAGKVLGPLAVAILALDLKDDFLSGDLDSAVLKATNLQDAIDGARALADHTEKKVRTWEDGIGVSREARAKAVEAVDEELDGRRGPQ